METCQRATQTEREVDRGETPTKSRVERLKTFGELVDLHIDDMCDVGNPPRRSKSAALDPLQLHPGKCNFGLSIANGSSASIVNRPVHPTRRGFRIGLPPGYRASRRRADDYKADKVFCAEQRNATLCADFFAIDDDGME
ncbi:MULTISPECIES: hypothetical protein [unclassified Mesorhizobium]|uniref:hypothetical protein n=1 Tax=unclassified Mesorhizobium TaxID=325217 RepID=UPI0016755968|nr:MULTISPECIES: hypothetical protein [unclassified Mesorhizobium]